MGWRRLGRFFFFLHYCAVELVCGLRGSRISCHLTLMGREGEAWVAVVVRPSVARCISDTCVWILGSIDIGAACGEDAGRCMGREGQPCYLAVQCPMMRFTERYIHVMYMYKLLTGWAGPKSSIRFRVEPTIRSTQSGQRNTNSVHIIRHSLSGKEREHIHPPLKQDQRERRQRPAQQRVRVRPPAVKPPPQESAQQQHLSHLQLLPEPTI